MPGPRQKSFSAALTVFSLNGLRPIALTSTSARTSGSVHANSDTIPVDHNSTMISSHCPSSYSELSKASEVENLHHEVYQSSALQAERRTL